MTLRGLFMNKNFEKKIGDFMDRHQICYLSSIDDDGYPNTKALSEIRERNGMDFFYMRTKANTIHVNQLIKNPKACVYFCDAKYSKGLMVRGNVEIVTDKDTKAFLWKDSDSIYFGNGKSDSNYCVLKFNIKDARFYNNFRSEDLAF